MKNTVFDVMKYLKCTCPVILILLLSGCCLFDPLPDGKAPDGIIISNAPRQDFDVSSAVNYMTTSLSIYLLTNPLPESICVMVQKEAAERLMSHVGAKNWCAMTIPGTLWNRILRRESTWSG